MVLTSNLLNMEMRVSRQANIAAVLDVMAHWQDYEEKTEACLLDFVLQVLAKPEHAHADHASVLMACRKRAGFFQVRDELLSYPA
jgi:hypothetical protein